MPPVNSKRPGQTLFADLLTEATAARTAPDFALESGVDVYGLCRYAAGAVSSHERRVIEGQLARHPWAMDRVVALVKATRGPSPDPRAVRILEAARSGNWSGLLASRGDTGAAEEADSEAALVGLLAEIGDPEQPRQP